MKQDYICSVCGERAILKDIEHIFLICGCDKGSWVSSQKGGHYTNSTGAKPIPANEKIKPQFDIIKLKRKIKKI